MRRLVMSVLAVSRVASLRLGAGGCHPGRYSCRSKSPIQTIMMYSRPFHESSCALSSRMRYQGVQSFYDFRQLTPEDLTKQTDQLIQDAKAVYDSVGAQGQEALSFKTVVKPLLDVERESATRAVTLELAAMVAISKELRDASSECEKKLDQFGVEMDMRKDVFENIVAFSKTEEAEKMSPELKRFLQKAIVTGKRNGLHLDEEKREEIKTVKKKISELGITFTQNLNADTTHLFFDESDLNGIPDDLLKSFERNEDGKCKVTMKYPHLFPVTRKCRNPKTRQLMETAYQSRCKDNVGIIEELVELRQRQADLLGYPNHAAYVLELRMAKEPGLVANFLSDLGVKLQPLWEKERDTMLKMKEEECKELKLDFSGKLDFWDFRYYMTMVEEKHFAVDQQKLKEYFPMEVVTKGLMNIYQTILGLKFTQLKGGEVWHEDVEMYQVDDAASGETLGYFYLDLYPRDGKYGHACMVQLQQGCHDADGKKQKSVVAMLTNFSKPTADKPSLLDHREVETYFHEFGHVMHGICSTATSSKFFGVNVERDFVEAPSQMLENWVWREESLRLMSAHYKDGSALPKDMLDKLIASKLANAGGFLLRQIFLATFDQKVHTRGKADTAKLLADIYKEILGIDTIPGTNFAAIFGHLVGYDAQYYGYLWSEVFSADMFESRFAKEGVMNSTTGLDYRNKILAPGGSLDASEMLINFLGREPNQEAFLRSKGLSN